MPPDFVGWALLGAALFGGILGYCAACVVRSS